MLGVISGLVQWLPLAVLAPIIVYVAIDITVQAFQATPPKHAPAMVLGFLPSVAYLVAIKAGNPAWIAPEQFARLATTVDRSEEHTSELQSLMRISYAVFCWKKKNKKR